MNVYEILTGKIMDMLEQGHIPWKKPWRSNGGPRNLVSKKSYRGINQFLLNCSDYESPYWLTYKQAADKGGQVRRGEKSTLVVFWKWLDSKDSDLPDTDTGELNPTSKIPLLRYYNVFNMDQVDGIKPPPAEKTDIPFTPNETAEQIIENMPNRPPIHYGGDRAYYHSRHDYLQIPHRETFHSPEGLYATMFHELIHATGHASRVGRKGVTETTHFGSHDYSQEELVAEFGASMLSGIAGIEQQVIENSAGYIQGWLKTLKNDKKILVHAAGQAQRAADFILRKEVNQETDE